MTLRRLSSSMAAFTVGLGGSASAIVATTTQAAITSACEAAGAGGSVYFPPGVYEVEDLAVTHENQTWELSPTSILKRSGGGHALTVSAAGFRIYGGTIDVDALAIDYLTNQKWAIDAWTGNAGSGFGLELDDVTLMNGNSWGILASRSPFIINRMKTQNMGYAAILFQCKELRNAGEVSVQNCNVDGNNANYHGQGGILLRCEPTNALAGGLLVNPKVKDCRVALPEQTSVSQADEPGDLHTNSVLIEVHNSSGPVITGNLTSYGKIGVSINSAIGGIISGNTISEAFQYGIEIASYNGDGSTGMACVGNFVRGVNGQASGAAAPSIGVSLSGGATKNNIVANYVVNCSIAVGQSGGATGNNIATNITS